MSPPPLGSFRMRDRVGGTSPWATAQLNRQDGRLSTQPAGVPDDESETCGARTMGRTDERDGSQQAEADPVLSVVIPCRNAADTLGVQLEALAAQQCSVPWEVVLCDNGSTDASRSIAVSFRTRLPRLTIVDAIGCRGAGSVRNVGAVRARGRWIAFCDADDEVAPGWLAAMARALADHRLVAGPFEGQRLNDPQTLRSRAVPQESGLQTADYGTRLPHAGAGNLGIHRDLFLALGGFDPQLRWLEDTDLCWRAQLSGATLTFIPGAVIHVRLRSTLSGSVRQGWEYGRAHAVLQERYQQANPPRTTHDAEAAGSVNATTRLRLSEVARDPRGSAWRIGHALGRRMQRWDTTNPLAFAPPRLATSDASDGLHEEGVERVAVTDQHAQRHPHHPAVVNRQH